ncbi:MAG TPA: DNA polymerase III subunit [Polyangiaceae bacterium]|jgi:DNA polymerase-3 subunit delta'|nr:DNA polymerase III subunit [Polyangiaceae bacterium]
MTARNVFDGIEGQPAALETIQGALRQGRVHHAYRFEGPDGVGKEKVAFALAQSLVCERGGPFGCGECNACRRAVHLSEDDPAVPRHPDVVLVQRGLYPPSALGTSTRETSGIGVEQIRKVVLARAGFSPHEGRALVFIVRDAHELTQQAANALLKTLEEPARSVHFVLITSHPRRLLDTIRSRTLAVRFGPLPDDLVARILERHGKPAVAVDLAGGSASAALSLSEDDTANVRAEFVNGALAALAAPDLGSAIAFAGSRPEQRDDLKQRLEELSIHFAREARKVVGADADVAERHARRHAVVVRTLDAVERNAQPGLALESMIAELRAV